MVLDTSESNGEELVDALFSCAAISSNQKAIIKIQKGEDFTKFAIFDKRARIREDGNGKCILKRDFTFDIAVLEPNDSSTPYVMSLLKFSKRIIFSCFSYSYLSR